MILLGQAKAKMMSVAPGCEEHYDKQFLNLHLRMKKLHAPSSYNICAAEGTALRQQSAEARCQERRYDERRSANFNLIRQRLL